MIYLICTVQYNIKDIYTIWAWKTCLYGAPNSLVTEYVIKNMICCLFVVIQNT